MIDLDELERLCREATRGPWESLRTCVYFAHGIGGFDIANCPKPETNAELIAALRNAAPKLIAMARLGKIAIRYIDRANDVADCDPADRILSEWAAEVNAVLAAMQEQEQEP